jgi:methionyl aminopeptidase
MRVSSSQYSNGFFKLKNEDWLIKQRVAGKCVATCLNTLLQYVKNGTTLTSLQLSHKTEEIMKDFDCSPTFKGYKGFPEAVCISVNKELVHGIPKDKPFEDGDVVSFDLGATYKGAIADSAVTCIYGNAKNAEHLKLIKATEESLMKGIQAIAVEKRLGVIGNAIYKSAKGNGFSVVTNYGGHGLDWDHPHAAPFVDNKSTPDQGFRIQSGLAIAIEPMLVIGPSAETKTLEDKWTVATREIGAHFEHSVFVHTDHVEIVTDRGQV